MAAVEQLARADLVQPRLIADEKAGRRLAQVQIMVVAGR
jgi:hypothetical protein